MPTVNWVWLNKYVNTVESTLTRGPMFPILASCLAIFQSYLVMLAGPLLPWYYLFMTCPVLAFFINSYIQLCTEFFLCKCMPYLFSSNWHCVCCVYLLTSICLNFVVCSLLTINIFYTTIILQSHRRSNHDFVLSSQYQLFFNRLVQLPKEPLGAFI